MLFSTKPLEPLPGIGFLHGNIGIGAFIASRRSAPAVSNNLTRLVQMRGEIGGRAGFWLTATGQKSGQGKPQENSSELHDLPFCAINLMKRPASSIRLM